MTGRKAEAGFIIRVVRSNGRRQIIVYDLRTGRSQAFTTWSRAVRNVRQLSDESGTSLR